MKNFIKCMVIVTGIIGSNYALCAAAAMPITSNITTRQRSSSWPMLTPSIQTLASLNQRVEVLEQTVARQNAPASIVPPAPVPSPAGNGVRGIVSSFVTGSVMAIAQQLVVIYALPLIINALASKSKKVVGIHDVLKNSQMLGQYKDALLINPAEAASHLHKLHELYQAEQDQQKKDELKLNIATLTAAAQAKFPENFSAIA